MRLVILGASGAGKTTQADGLCRYFNIPLISTTEITRNVMAQNDYAKGVMLSEGSAQGALAQNIAPETMTSFTHLGHLIQPHPEMGEMVSDNLDQMMIAFLLTRLNKPDFNRGWVLEGYPHTAFQAEELDFLLGNLGHSLDWAIYLQVPQAVMVSRSLGCSLPDEQPEIVQRRVEIFYDRTVPILEYYDRRRRLLTINGDQLPEVVQQNIVTLLSTPE